MRTIITALFIFFLYSFTNAQCTCPACSGQAWYINGKIAANAAVMDLRHATDVSATALNYVTNVVEVVVLK